MMKEARRIRTKPTDNIRPYTYSQFPIHYNKGTSGSSHSNLDPMKIIMQELQLMRKDIEEMRGNIINLSKEDMVTTLLMLELLSIILMIAMRAIDLELKIVIMIYLVKELQEMKLEMKGIM
ncbi:hypothetical protein M9H77_29878 [Catharanthus roseus]|uniref:Uncharacterized protein n=1 Tax=Catharanthus roseus TaxID=4058 RepID=A0ACB9ZW18_CATRO|nr:hypothetical protein M9H77_29878 [Catharanthus roseus]